MHILWTRFVGYKIPGSRIFSSIFRTIHRYIGYSRKIAGSGSVGRPLEYFPVYLEFGKCGCTGFVEPAPGIFSGVFMILKMWVHWVYGTGPRCIFGHFENADAWVCGEIFMYPASEY